MVQKIDEKVFAKVDHSNVIRYLTAAGRVFAESQLLSPQEAEKLRTSLGSVSFAEADELSVLIEMRRAHPEFIALLTTHFGNLGFSLNLFRYTVRGVLNQSSYVLHNLGEEFLTKAQLLFNRPFYLYLGSSCEKRSLYSSVLVDLAELVYLVLEDIEKLQKDLSFLLPSQKAEESSADDALDEKLRQELGFQAKRVDALPCLSENTFKKKLIANFELLVESIHDFVGLLDRNRGTFDVSKLRILCENLSGRLALLEAFQFPKTDDIEIWEQRRLHFLKLILTFNNEMMDLKDMLTEELGKSATIEGARAHSVSNDIVRSMAASMIQGGVPALRAQESACALVHYCEKNQLSPQEILVGELHKINPYLTVGALDLFKKLAGEKTIVRSLAGEKQQTLTKQNDLMARFHQQLSRLGVFASMAALVGAVLFQTQCGVKTAPKSALIDYRPEIHYHRSKRSREKAEEKKEAPASREDLPKETLRGPTGSDVRP